MFEVTQFYEHVRPRIKPYLSDVYNFSPTDSIEEIMLRISTTSYLRIEEYLNYKFGRNQYENLVYADILNPTLNTAKSDMYYLVDLIDNIFVIRRFNDYLRLQEIPSAKLKITLYDSYTFLEFIPTYVQRIYENLSVEEQFKLKEIDALRLQALEIEEQLRLILRRRINDTFNPTELLRLTLRPRKTENVNYGLTISGFVDNYFEPGYCNLGYAGIPI
jgi:hypothetical protein